MKIIRNKYIPWQGYKAIFLFGVLFVRGNALINERTMRHETIHSKQFIEISSLFAGLLSPLIVVGLWWLWVLLSVTSFYILYVLEWFVKILIYKFDTKKAYKNLSFEREAYANQNIINYTKTRKWFSWIKYIRKN